MTRPPQHVTAHVRGLPLVLLLTWFTATGCAAIKYLLS